MLYNLTTKHILIEIIKFPFKIILKLNFFQRFLVFNKFAFLVKTFISSFYRSYKDISDLIINYLIPEMKQSYHLKVEYIK